MGPKLAFKHYRILEEFYIILGSLLTAAGVVFFANPAKIANGGVGGIAIIIYHTLGLNAGYSIFLLSVPLFFLGWKYCGKKFVLKSLYGTLLYSIFTILLTKEFGNAGILDYGKDTSVLLSAIYGGITFGLGCGFVMKSGANTGGTDIVAQIMAKETPLSLGTALTVVDTIIIAASGYFFGLESVFYAIITVYITGTVINKVIMGTKTFMSKTVYIISDKNEHIQRDILVSLDLGGTILRGSGMFSGEDRPVIMTVVANNKLGRLITLVKNYDKSAFVVVQETYKAMGEGFSDIEKEAWAGRHS